MPQNRKHFLRQLSSGLLVAAMPGQTWANGSTSTTVNKRDFDKSPAADDEKYWKQIAKKYYAVSREYTNMENGYFGVQSKPVLQAFQKNTAYVNTELARFARKEYPAVAREARNSLAAFLQVSTDELIITRNATEALNIAIQGYPFRPDDEVLITQLDYFSMIETFRMLEKRGRIKVNAFDLPLIPENEDQVVEAYRKAITPKTKVILLTHVSNINGLIIPVTKIASIAKERGIDIITDSAHALGQLPFRLAGLGSDFVGMNLHKWMGNPIGAGVLYIKKERIAEMTALFGDFTAAENNINKLAHFGTTTLAVTMTIPDSLAFHQLLGTENISARLQYLKNIWVSEFQNHSKIEMVTAPQKDLSCAIASFRVKGKTAEEAADYLWKEHKVLTVARTLGTDGCVRVTPSVYSSADDVKKLVMGLKKFAEK
jgi:isopenicillin-N epimerase